MKYAITLGSLSLVILAGSSLYPGMRCFLVWSALSFGNVAIGYAGLGTRVFGKRTDGTISLPFKILNLPYLAYTWLVWHIFRLVSSEASVNIINDGLVIGRRLLSSEMSHGFDHYVDLTAEFEDPTDIRRQSGYRCLPILDASIPAFEDLMAAVDEVVSGRAFVHCAQGHGRTGVFALALLMRRGSVQTVEQGIALLQSLRPAVRLNKTQLSYAQQYLATITEENGGGEFALPTSRIQR